MKTREKIRHQKFWIMSSLVVTLIIFLSGHALTAPFLIVSTDTGIYAYLDPADIDDNYINDLADEIYPALGEQEGFMMGPSGGTVNVFTYFDPSIYQIFLIGETDGTDNMGMTFGDDPLIFDGSGSFAPDQLNGYQGTPYAYLPMSQDLDDWTTQVLGGHTFYLCSKTFTYDRWPEGNYLFAGVDYNHDGMMTGNDDKHSPKTTSSGGIPAPEPSTIILLGFGLIGLLGAGLKKSKKSTSN